MGLIFKQVRVFLRMHPKSVLCALCFVEMAMETADKIPKHHDPIIIIIEREMALWCLAEQAP